MKAEDQNENRTKTETEAEWGTPRRIVYVHDMIDPSDPQGRTYKQVNAAKTHAIPVGALVENVDSGVRMFVVAQTRDCDMGLLYSLSHVHPNDEDEFDARTYRHHGYPEYALLVIPGSMSDNRHIAGHRE